MLATFTPDAGSLITLAGEDADKFDQPNNLRGGGGGIVQTESIVGAGVPFRAHRGNVLTTLSFEVNKSYASHEAAVEANFDLFLSVTEKLGTFALKTDAGATIISLTSASVSMEHDALAGVVAMRRFTVEGVVA